MMEITRKWWAENIRPQYGKLPNFLFESDLIEFGSKALDIIDPIVSKPRDVTGQGKVKCTCVEPTLVSFLNIQLPVVAKLGDVSRSECKKCNGTGKVEEDNASS